jgi:hypothetical protein
MAAIYSFAIIFANEGKSDFFVYLIFVLLGVLNWYLLKKWIKFKL